MDLVAQQLLRALRGSRSQLALARRLGYRANPVTDWEHGRRYPTAEETLRLAHRVGVDVHGAFARFAPSVTLDGKRGSYSLQSWMRQLLGTTRVSELARRMGRGRPTLSRWLSGTGKPRLPEFLAFVDATTGRVPDFVAELVLIERVPALSARYEITQAAKRVAFEQPWTEAILRVLETDTYRSTARHDSNWLGGCLGLSPRDVDACLSLLEAARVVELEHGKYANLRPLNVDTRGGRAALHAIKGHWADVAAARARSPSGNDLFAYNLCSASGEDMVRIRDVMRAAYREIRSIVAASKPLERVALINLHFVDWDVAEEGRSPRSEE